MQDEKLKIKLAFDPAELDLREPDHEIVAMLFKRDGLPLRVWAIVKMRYLTNQHFLPAMKELQLYCDKAQQQKMPPWGWVDELLNVLWTTGVTEALFGNMSATMHGWQGLWLRHWDYVNPNIMRSVWCEYLTKDGAQIEKVIGSGCRAIGGVELSCE